MKIHHCYLPCLQFICNLWHLILGEYRILTFLLLLAIVFQQEDGLTGKQDDGCEIAEGEKSHRDICKTPCKIQRYYSSDHHHCCYSKTIDKYTQLGVPDISHVGFSIIIIADDAAKGKQPYHYRNKRIADVSDFVGQGILGELNTIEAVRSTPLTRMMNAVQEHTTNVSVKTPKACINPCFTG